MSFHPPLTGFRVLYRTTFCTRSLVAFCDTEDVVIQDPETEQETDRFMRETIQLVEMSTGLFVQARNGKSFQVEPADAAIARAMLASQVDPNRSEDPFGDRSVGVQRWQYVVLNVGTFNSAERMTSVLARAGSQGWELAVTMDKASNWFNGFEKGFLLLKRPVPDGFTPKQWCVTVRG